MGIGRGLFAASLVLTTLLLGCGSDGKSGSSCTVEQAGNGDVTVRCDDGESATLHAPKPVDAGASSGSCSVKPGATSVTITCPDGSHATIPSGSTSVDGGTNPDAGPSSCTVARDQQGTVTITCPDGSTATLPGSSPGGNDVKAIGATAASCGTCHDSSAAKTHFKVMTFEGDAGPEEACGTCHRETSVEPVSKAHARAEFGAPGLKVQLASAYIDPNERTITTRVVITDASNAPVARDGMSFNFVIAKVGTVTALDGSETIAGPYESYLTRSVTQKDNPDYPLGTSTPRTATQPTAEAGTGSFTLVSPGVYDYVFKYVLPAGYDASATHMLGVYATRTVETTRFVANAERFFVPNAPNATPVQRDAVHTETCNNCHNPLSAHGGARQDVQLCLACHTQGAIDPESGNSLDFNVMVHRIHRGKNLPSVAAGGHYSIVGYGNNTVDFSEVGYPQPIENCQSCHTDSDGDRWLTNGSRAACTSCHESIDKPWKDGGHPFPLSADATCTNSNCHGPDGKVRDAREAHLVPLNDPKAGVLDLDILSVSVPSADMPPEIRIRARVGKRSTADSALTPVSSVDNLLTLNVFLNGPNTGYLLSGNTIHTFKKADLVDLTPGAPGSGELTFTLPKSLREIVGTLGDPEIDSYTIGLRAVYDPTPSGTPDDDRVDQRENPTASFTVGEELVTRRAVVLTEKCNACHGELSAHGGETLAKNVEQCVLCHTGSLDTRVRQGANKDAGPTKSLRFATLVHRIHGDVIAKTPYVLYGYSASAPYPRVDFSAVPFPGDVRDCSTCHIDGTNYLPLPEGDPPTETAVLDENGHVVAQ